MISTSHLISFELIFFFAIILGLISVLSGIRTVLSWVKYRISLGFSKKMLTQPEFYGGAQDTKLIIHANYNRLLTGTIFFITITIASFLLWLHIYSIVVKNPVKVAVSNPRTGAELTSYQEEIFIAFNVPVRMDSLALYQAPGIKGRWHKKKYLGFIPYGRKVVFIPERTFRQNEKIMLYLANIKNPGPGKFGSEYLFEFYPPKPPQLNLRNPITSKEIRIDTNFVFDVIGDKTGFRYRAQVDPVHEIVLEKDSDTKLVYKPARNFSQNGEFVFRLYQTPVIRDLKTGIAYEEYDEMEIYKFAFRTVKAPFITEFLPIGESVTPSSQIRIKFTESMAYPIAPDIITVAPNLNYHSIWDSARKVLTLVHSGLEKNTFYTVILNPGIRSETGGSIAQKSEFTFKTVGHLQITNINPDSDLLPPEGIKSIRINFDQPPLKKSAEDKFSIYPPVNGKFLWMENSMVFELLSELNRGTEYILKINSGIESLYGLPSIQEYQKTLFVPKDHYSLNVPLFTQQEQFTCNIATVRMLLAYRGINLPEKLIKEKIGISGRRGNGNPHAGMTIEYGTYWEPIEKFASMYRPTRLLIDPSISEMLGEVIKGNPVMVWGQNGWSHPHDISWTNENGKNIYAVNGMHSYLIKGFNGPIDNPETIIVNDPWRGTYPMDKTDFIRRFNYFKRALVVE